MEMIAVKLVFSSLFYIILVDNSYIEEIMLISEGIKDMKRGSKKYIDNYRYSMKKLSDAHESHSHSVYFESM